MDQIVSERLESTLALFCTNANAPPPDGGSLLYRLDGELRRRDVIGERVLVDVERRQPDGGVVLEFRGEPLLDNVIAALRVQVIQRVEVPLSERSCGRRHEGHAEKTAEFVSPRARGDLKSRYSSEVRKDLAKTGGHQQELYNSDLSVRASSIILPWREYRSDPGGSIYSFSTILCVQQPD